jgi:hypothetical protein
MHQPLLQKLTLRNETQIDLGAWMKRCLRQNLPDKVVMDKSGANYEGLANINLLLILAGFATMIDICQALKGHTFPKTLFFMRFSFMSGTAFRIATLKRSWKKEGVMLYSNI